MSQQINLFNPIFLKKKKYFSALTMVQGLGMILLGSVVVVAYAQIQLKALKAETVATANQLRQTRAQLAKVAADYAPRQKSKDLEEEIVRTELEIKHQKRAFDIVQSGGVGNTNGYSEYLRAFARQIVDGLWLTSFSISGAGSNLELRGKTLQPQLVPIYITKLGQEPIMRGKAFDTLAMEMPEAVAEGKADTVSGTTGKPPRQASYIEFTLRSSDDARNDMMAGGAEAVARGADVSGARLK